MTPHQPALLPEAAPLIRALARELALFQARELAGKRHLGWGHVGLCPAYPSPGRECSHHCTRVRYWLVEAANYLGCAVEELYGGKERR